MANFIGLMLSLVIIFQFVIFSTDLISYQITLSRVYSSISYINDFIVKEGEINNEIKDYVKNNLKAEIRHFSNEDISSISYGIYFSYEPIFKVIKNANSEIIIEQRVLLD
ncbi:MAG: hypothetical protein VB122_06985 [Erysipelotrichales bacterium]|nr:hypothetical protein [Bacilli bacterium]MEA4821947.1 hypothetical protein [Erysipelotrichales bacterium]